MRTEQKGGESISALQVPDLNDRSCFAELFYIGGKKLLNAVMKTLREKTGERIKRIREERGLSLARFGEILGLGKTAVHQYEHGSTTPTLETLVKIAELGDISLDQLITGKEKVQQLETPMPAEGLDKELVRVVIEAVEEGLGDLHLELKPDKKAQLVITLCEMFQEEKQVDKPTILRLIKLAA